MKNHTIRVNPNCPTGDRTGPFFESAYIDQMGKEWLHHFTWYISVSQLISLFQCSWNGIRYHNNIDGVQKAKQIKETDKSKNHPVRFNPNCQTGTGQVLPSIRNMSIRRGKNYFVTSRKHEYAFISLYKAVQQNIMVWLRELQRLNIE